MSEYYEGVKEKEEKVFLLNQALGQMIIEKTVTLVMPKSSGLAIELHRSVQ